jgi:glycosyltransferase involved in cell wall biosynthesis
MLEAKEMQIRTAYSSPDLLMARSEAGRRILIAIPCFNEEITIGSLVLKTLQYSPDVLVINDGSTDATAEIAEKAGAMTISHTRNRGKAAAVMTAVRFARKLGYDVLVLLDGDGQHSVDDIPNLIDPIIHSGADLVIGSRFINNGNGHRIPMYRRLGQKTLDLLTNTSMDFNGTDTQSGFRALSKMGIAHFKVNSDGYNIESDMIHHFKSEGLTIVEAPIRVRYDIPNGHKKEPFQHGFDILTHIIGLISYERPILAFGVPGMVVTLAGLMLGVYSLSVYFATGAFHYILFMVGITTLFLGLLFVVAAFILNSISYIVKRRVYLGQD